MYLCPETSVFHTFRSSNKHIRIRKISNKMLLEQNTLYVTKLKLFFPSTTFCSTYNLFFYKIVIHRPLSTRALDLLSISPEWNGRRGRYIIIVPTLKYTYRLTKKVISYNYHVYFYYLDIVMKFKYKFCFLLPNQLSIW